MNEILQFLFFFQDFLEEFFFQNFSGIVGGVGILLVIPSCLEQPPICYQPLLFYGKILNLSFWENFENSTPVTPFLLYKAGSSNYVSSIIKFEYELPHELPDDLRLGTLGNQEMTMKSQIWVETQASVQSLLQK